MEPGPARRKAQGATSFPLGLKRTEPPRGPRGRASGAESEDERCTHEKRLAVRCRKTKRGIREVVEQGGREARAKHGVFDAGARRALRYAAIWKGGAPLTFQWRRVASSHGGEPKAPCCDVGGLDTLGPE